MQRLRGERVGRGHNLPVDGIAYTIRYPSTLTTIPQEYERVGEPHECQFNQCRHRATTCPLDRHINPACAQVFKLFRGRVFDCRWYPGAGASIAAREETKVKSKATPTLRGAAVGSNSLRGWQSKQRPLFLNTGPAGPFSESVIGSEYGCYQFATVNKSLWKKRWPIRKITKKLRKELIQR
jgi:hypothetical protein